MKSLSIVVSLSLLGACMVGEEAVEDKGDLDVLHDDDPEYGEEEGQADGSIAANVRGWTIPADVAAIGDQQYVAYTDAGPYSGGRNCGGGLLAGTRELGDYLQANFAGITGYGGYACRPNTANTSQLSVHGTGRAIDVMIPLVKGDANNATGDKIANFLVQNAEKIGVQFIIWDRNSWGASRSKPKLRSYGGPHPHTDHIHVELTPDGARRMTEWFTDTGNAPPPPASDTATVTATSLNLRSGPSTSYTILRSMPNGSTVEILQGPSNSWYQVTYDGTTGWCHGDYLQL
jgi:hypothetical protein